MTYSNPYAGSEWIKSSLKVEDMSELGEAVADLVGQVFLGIYHLPTKSLKKVQWNDEYIITLVIGKSLCTVDNNELTRLVVLAHDRLIRVDIEGVAPRYLRLIFHQRKAREGGLSERCPTMEEHITLIRKHYEQGQNGHGV